MSDTIFEITHERGRAMKQLFVFAFGAIIGAVFLAAGIWMAVVGTDAFGIILGIVLAIIGAAALAGSVLAMISNLRSLTGKAAPIVAIDTEGIHWHQGVSVPWAEATGITVESGTALSFADGADRRIDLAVEKAMAAGGVNDGRRRIVVDMRDRAQAAARSGKAGFLIDEGPQPGSGRFRMVLDTVTDDATFAQAAEALRQESTRRGVPFEVTQLNS